MTDYTAQDATTLIEKLRAEREYLVTTVARLDDAAAEQRPTNKEDAGGESEWSAKQQLQHLVHAETMWINGARDAVAHPGEPVTARGSSLGGADEAVTTPLADLVRALDEQRASNMTWITGLSPEELGRTGTHAQIGEMTAMQWIRALYRHDRMHAEQIEAELPDA